MTNAAVARVLAAYRTRDPRVFTRTLQEHAHTPVTAATLLITLIRHCATPLRISDHPRPVIVTTLIDDDDTNAGHLAALQLLTYELNEEREKGAGIITALITDPDPDHTAYLEAIMTILDQIETQTDAGADFTTAPAWMN